MNYFAGNNLFGRIRRLFGAAPLGLQVAALPWRKRPGGIEIMLITSRNTGRWVLPKGWPEGREEFSDAAAREAAEEAGVTGTISRREIGRYVYLKGGEGGEDIRCEVLVYPLAVGEVAGKWKEKGQRKRRWVSPEEAAAMVREPDLSALISTFDADPRRTAG
jgi:8-oxo-dGTP pyrophosphatase MutT (NUDIX family)